jgi:hypothetical protein
MTAWQSLARSCESDDGTRRWGVAGRTNEAGATRTRGVVEPMTGIEPAYSAWEVSVAMKKFPLLTGS